MTTTMKMLSVNTPLSQWRQFEKNQRDTGAYGGTYSYGWNNPKNIDKVAASIFSQLSHEETQVLIAREFDELPATLRLALRTLCNGETGSGNVRKGVQRLDRLMGGKLLREQKHSEVFQTMTRDGWKSKKVNEAVAGATRKYGIVKK